MPTETFTPRRTTGRPLWSTNCPPAVVTHGLTAPAAVTWNGGGSGGSGADAAPLAAGPA